MTDVQAPAGDVKQGPAGTYPLNVSASAAKRLTVEYLKKHDLRVGSTPENLASVRLHQSGIPFRAQHTIEGHRVDFAFPDLGIVLEVDGYHHDRPDAAYADQRRDQVLREAGWVVLRVHDGPSLNDQLRAVALVLHGAPVRSRRQRRVESP